MNYFEKLSMKVKKWGGGGLKGSNVINCCKLFPFGCRELCMRIVCSVIVASESSHVSVTSALHF